MLMRAAMPAADPRADREATRRDVASVIAGDPDTLLATCADRPQPSGEAVAWNAWYGHARLLKAYAGLDPDEPLYVSIPHGVSFIAQVWDVEERAPLRTFYSFQRTSDAALSRQGRRAVILGCAPFLLVPHLRPDLVSSERRGTLFFPAHSTHHETVESDFDHLAADLRRRTDLPGPVRVCVYWRDVNLGHHEPFVRAGFEVVSAGHMFDSAFHFRLWALLGRTAVVATNAVGSHIPYAMAAGCAVMLTAAETPAYTVDTRFAKALSTSPIIERAFFRYFPVNQLVSGGAARQLADDLLGTWRRPTPDALRRALLVARHRHLHWNDA